MSEDGEAVAGLVPKIQAAFDKYTDGTVSIIDKQNGGLNDTYAILKQLNTVYPTLSEESRAYLNEAIAGNRQNKVLVAIMNNWENVEAAVKSATESTGSANRENEKYLDSINGKISQFQSQVQLLWKNTINSELIKFIVELGTAMVKLVDTIGMLPVAISLGMGALMLFSKGFQTFAISIIPAVLTKLGLVVAVENGVAIAATGAAISVKALSMAFLTLTPLLVAGAIYGVAKAYDYFTISVKEASEAINDGFNKSKDNINTLKALANEYETLAKKEIKSVDDKERLLEIQMQVNSQYLYGQKNIDLYTTAIDGNTTAIDENVKAIKEKARAEAEEFIKLHQAEYNISKRFLEEAYVVPNVGQFENAEEALVSLSKAMDNASLAGNEFLYNQIKKTYDLLLSEVTTANEAVVKFEGSQDLLKKAFDNTSDSAEKAAMAVYDYAKGLDDINGVVDSVQTSLKDINSLIENNGKLTADQVLDAIQAYGILPDQISGTTDVYKIEESVLVDLRDQHIKTVNDSIQAEINQTNVTKDEVQKRLVSYGYEIQTLKDIADAKTTALREAYNLANEKTGGYSDGGLRNELFEKYYADLKIYQESSNAYQELIDRQKTYTDLLNNLGTGKDNGSGNKYEPSTEQSAIKALYDAEIISIDEYINRLLALEKSKYSEYSNKSAQEIEAMLLSRNETVAKKTEEYLSLHSEIGGLQIQLDEENLNQISISLEAYDSEIKKLDNSLSLLGNINTVEEKATETELLGKKFNLATQEISRLEQQLTSPSLTSSMRELISDKIISLKIDVVAFKDSVEDALTELTNLNKSNALAQAEKDYADELAEIEEKIYNGKSQEVWEEASNDRIDALQDRIDKLQEESDELDEQAEREQKLLDIEEARLKLTNLQEQKTVQVYRADANGGMGGWVKFAR